MSLREQAQQALVQMASFEQSAYINFVSQHSGQKGLYGSGDVHGDPGNIFYGCEAEQKMFFRPSEETFRHGEVTPAVWNAPLRSFGQKIAWRHSRRRLIQRRRWRRAFGEAGQRTMFASQKHEIARARFDDATQPIVPYTKQQLLEWGGQVRGVPASFDN